MKGYYLACTDCGYSMHFSTGPGFAYPSVCASALAEIRAGKKYPSLKKAADKYPNAALSVDTVLYVCPKCRTAEPLDLVKLWIPVDEHGNWIPDPGMDVGYVPEWCLGEGGVLQGGVPYSIANPGPTVPTARLKVVSYLVHRCPQCGARMKIWKGGELRCPKCGGKLSEPRWDGIMAD